MFNLDNSSAGIDRSTLQIDRRGNKPMAPRRLKTGQGFSLFVMHMNGIIRLCLSLGADASQLGWI